MARSVLAGDLPAQAIVATAMVAAKLFVGIQTDHQQTVAFAGLKSFAPLELAVDPNPRPAQLLRVQTLADIAKSVVTDRARMPHPLLPLRQLGLGGQLQEAGNVRHFAQNQTQPNGAGWNVRLGTPVGKTARQEGEIKTFLGISLELAQLGESVVIHPRALPP